MGLQYKIRGGPSIAGRGGNMFLRRLSIVCTTLFLILLFSPAAYAYLDPGTGSYIFQLLLAAVVGLGFVIKLYWTKIKGFFARLFSRDGRQEDAEHEDH
jgi:hypothetical protein